MMVISVKDRVVGADYAKWAKNVLIFSAPALLVLGASLVNLIPHEAWYGAFLIAVWGLLADLFKKWLAVNKKAK